ncbi:MAG: hypothetical protein PHG02_08455 [Oscillospiraceae bacterium]|nr:hypothetical protein [Oscillospiraceae bacterium]
MYKDFGREPEEEYGQDIDYNLFEEERVPRELPGARKHLAKMKLNAIDSAQRNFKAESTGGVKPDLFYTGQQIDTGKKGFKYAESDHTVASKLESKEEYPQG